MSRRTTFSGYKGTWSIINKATYRDKTYGQYQSDLYGEDVPAIIADEATGKVILDDSYNSIDVDLGDYLDVPYEEVKEVE